MSIEYSSVDRLPPDFAADDLIVFAIAELGAVLGVADESTPNETERAGAPCV